MSSSGGSAVGMTVELENMTTSLDASFCEASLAAKDSLALEGGLAAEEGIIFLEHALPVSSTVKNRRRKRGMMALATCLLIGIVVLTVLLTKSDSSDHDPTINDGSDVGLVESESEIESESENEKDNIFADDLSRPSEYYVLEPLVGNPEGLFILDTPEGDAFSLISQEGLTSDLDIIQRYALVNLFFTTEGGGWTDFEGWSTRSDVCDWVGITCQNLIVTGIDLGKSDLLDFIRMYTSISSTLVRSDSEMLCGLHI
jgi:hypothetical protein